MAFDPLCECKQCGYLWKTILGRAPANCARCLSSNWQRPRKDLSTRGMAIYARAMRSGDEVLRQAALLKMKQERDELNMKKLLTSSGEYFNVSRRPKAFKETKRHGDSA